MRYDLRTLARRSRPGSRRKSVALREIVLPSTLATDLFRSCYLPVINAWTDGLPQIEAAYARALSDMVTDDAADVGSQIDGVADVVNRLLLILTPDLRSWALRTERAVRDKWRGAVLTATSVDLETMLGPEDVRATLETTIARNVALIKDVSAQAQGRISDAVFRGLNQRRPARDVAKDIREAVTMGRDRSIRIASHQLSSLSNELAAERRREAGLSAFAWHHSAKKHPRLDHLARNGHIYTENPSRIAPMTTPRA